MQDLRPLFAADPNDKVLRWNYQANVELFLRLSQRFGLTPMDRAKLTLPDAPDEEDPLLNRRDRYAG